MGATIGKICNGIRFSFFYHHNQSQNHPLKKLYDTQDYIFNQENGQLITTPNFLIDRQNTRVPKPIKNVYLKCHSASL